MFWFGARQVKDGDESFGDRIRRLAAKLEVQTSQVLKTCEVSESSVAMKTMAPLQPGHHYHIYNRGNNREDLFREERNYRNFLQLYVRHVLPIAITFAYCLMRNHFHFLVRIREVLRQTSQVSETCEV